MLAAVGSVQTQSMPATALRGGQRFAGNIASTDQSSVAVTAGGTSEVERLRSGLVGLRARIDDLISGSGGASSADSSSSAASGQLLQEYRDLKQQYDEISRRVSLLEEAGSKASQQNLDVASRISKLEEDNRKASKFIQTQVEAKKKEDTKSQDEVVNLRVEALQKENEEMKKELTEQSDRIKALESSEKEEMEQLRGMAKESIQSLQDTEKAEMEELTKMQADNAQLRSELGKAHGQSLLATATHHGRLSRTSRAGMKTLRHSKRRRRRSQLTA